MPDWIFISLIVVGILFFGALFNPDKKTKSKLAELFSDRPKRTNNDFYSSFFTDSKITPDIVSKIRDIFREQFYVDLDALEADDDFSKDYSLIWELDSLADVEIIIALEQEFDIEFNDGEASQMHSIRSIAEAVADKLNNQSNETK
jgi:acyl carrier protein